MTWLRKARPLLFIFGGVLLIGSLLGAGLLTAGMGMGALLRGFLAGRRATRIRL